MSIQPPLSAQPDTRGRARIGTPTDLERRVVALKVVLGCSRALLRVLGRPRRTGTLPGSGGVVVAANHVSLLDSLLLGTAVDSAGRVPRFLAARGLWSVPGLGWVLRRCEQIPVRRDSERAADAVPAAVAAAADGQCVVVFPEGRITRDPAGWPVRARTGAVRIAAAARVPIVPAALWGPNLVMPLGRRLPRPLPRRLMQVAFGSPVTVGDLLGPGPDGDGDRQAAPPPTDIRAAADALADRVDELLATLRGHVRTGPWVDPRRVPPDR